MHGYGVATVYLLPLFCFIILLWYFKEYARLPDQLIKDIGLQNSDLSVSLYAHNDCVETRVSTQCFVRKRHALIEQDCLFYLKNILDRICKDMRLLHCIIIKVNLSWYHVKKYKFFTCVLIWLSNDEIFIGSIKQNKVWRIMRRHQLSWL